MKEVLAKKYAKAINQCANLIEFYENLLLLNSLFTTPKFKDFVENTQIKKSKKLEFLLSIFEKVSPNFENFLKILLENSRLNCVDAIIKELDKQKAIREKTYKGFVFSKNALNRDELKELESKISAKFDAQIILENKLSQIDGVKITLDELGYELNFSSKSLQNKLNEFILKTI